MDLDSLIRTLSGQGTPYWIAAGAVALGATLLVAAALLQWRRHRASRPPRRGRRKAVPPINPSIVANYADQAPAPAAADPALVRRLTAAADRLAVLRADLAHWDELPGGSDLKPTASPVEYVFRSGEA